MATQTSVDALPQRRRFRVSPVQALAVVFVGLIVFWLGANLIDDPTHFLDLFLVGLTIGMVYALIALGYSLVYGILELINFAHGDVFMLGGMMTVTLVSAFGLGASGNVLVWVVPMLVITAAFTGILNTTIETVAYRPLRSAPRLAPLITAIGVSFILQTAGLVWKGPAPVSIRDDILPNSQIFHIGEADLSWNQLIVWIVTIPTLLALVWLVQKTKSGKAMRAVAQDKDAAAMMGINVNRTISFTFLTAGCLAGFAGVLYALFATNVQFDTGFRLGLFAFTAAVIGGIGNLPGAVLGAILIGLIENFNDGLTKFTPGSDWKSTIIFVILILTLVFRPEGLLGERTPEGFHSWPGWQQRLGKLAVGGVIAFLIAIFVNVLEASFGSTGSTSIFTFDGSAYLAFLVVGLIYVPEWSRVPLLGKIAIPLAAVALAITFPYWSGHMFTIPVFGEFPSTETGVVMLVFVMMAVGLNIVVGYAGLLDLGYVAFYAMGAYTAAWLASTQFAGAKCPKAGFGIDNCPVATVPAVNFNFGGVGITPGIGGVHVSIWLILAIAGLLTALIGVLIGLPTLRLRGDYLAIVTLGFGEILPQIARNGNDLGGFNLTGGPQGITPVDSPGFGNTISGWTGGFLPANYLTSPNSARVFYWTALALLAFTVFCSIRLRDSRLGRAWIAIREDEVAASAMGIPLMRTKTWAYACGAFFGGIAGAYFAAFKSSTFPQDFYFNISVFILCMVILGGMGNVWGVMLGAAFLTYLNQEGLANTGAWLNLHFGTHVDVPEYSGGIYGVIIVLVMLLRPQGLLPSARRKRELELGTHDEYLYDVETHDESLSVEPAEA